MIKQMLQNEEVVKRLERVAKELEMIKTNETNFEFFLPLLFATLEMFRTSDTPFPVNFFNKSKSINNGVK